MNLLCAKRDFDPVTNTIVYLFTGMDRTKARDYVSVTIVQHFDNEDAYHVGEIYNLSLVLRDSL